jgi:hypothetical protein
MQNKAAWLTKTSKTWTALIQSKELQRFIVAVLVSMVLHAFIISYLWGVFSNDAVKNPPTVTINARLVKHKTLEKTPEKLAVAPPKKPPEIKPEVIEPPQPLASAADAQGATDAAPEVNNTQVEASPIVSPEENQASAAETGVDKESGTEATGTETLNENVAGDEDLGMHRAKAYQYVETHFDVFTDEESKTNRVPAGTAFMVYQTLDNGTTYTLKNVVSPKGLASLIIPDLLQTSEGTITDQGLKPQHYLYQFGSRKNKTYTASFDWGANTLVLQNAKGTQSHILMAGTQDLLSFMYQFMFAPPLDEMHIKLTNGKKLSIYDYTFEGEEVLDTKLGKVNTVHLLHDAFEREEKTEIWLATEYRYLPVKIRKIEKQNKVYELVVKTIHTDVGSLSASQPSTESIAE